MKKAHIAILILVSAAVCFIVVGFSDFSTYQTFASAAEKPGTPFPVIGYLEKNMAMEYNPLTDPNHFIFYAKDKSGKISKVIFNGEKPRDIEKSEQIVMKGYVQGDAFHCTSIQMKCPSKYKKNDMTVTSKTS
jgi:cytochrome c-type biogenesis protein CcmE